jgi:hypothetical protein
VLAATKKAAMNPSTKIVLSLLASIGQMVLKIRVKEAGALSPSSLAFLGGVSCGMKYPGDRGFIIGVPELMAVVSIVSGLSLVRLVVEIRSVKLDCPIDGVYPMPTDNKAGDGLCGTTLGDMNEIGCLKSLMTGEAGMTSDDQMKLERKAFACATPTPMDIWLFRKLEANARGGVLKTLEI